MEKELLEDKVNNFDGIISNLNQELDKFRGLLSEKTVKPRVSDTYSKSLEIENDQIRSHNHELEIKLEAANEKICEFEMIIEEHRDKIKCLNENIESKKAELEDKNEVIEHLQEKMHELSSELISLRASSATQDESKYFVALQDPAVGSCCPKFPSLGS